MYKIVNQNEKIQFNDIEFDSFEAAWTFLDRLKENTNYNVTGLFVVEFV